jgi:uncharacterized membrane protein
MSPRARKLLWGMLAVGLVGRVVLAFETYGLRYDIDSVHIVYESLANDPLNVYSDVNGDPFNRWPYLPTFLAWVAASGGVLDSIGLPFHGTIQLPQIGADMAIAWLVQDFLGRRGHCDRVRLAAAGLVALGPSFWIVSAFHGQMDSLVALPAVGAIWLWDRMEPGVRRAAWCGLLIGLAVTFKTLPGVLLLVLLPWVASRREAAALIGSAAVLPVLTIAPFLIADPGGVVDAFRNHRAIVGVGGIGLLVQPELADAWLAGKDVELSGLNEFLLDRQAQVVALLMLPFMGLVLWRRPEPARGAALLSVALVVLGIGFAFGYVLWALPFALMAGYVWQAAAVQAGLLLPQVILYWHPFESPPTGLYTALMIAVWCAAAAALAVLTARVYMYPRSRIRSSMS